MKRKPIGIIGVFLIIGILGSIGIWEYQEQKKVQKEKEEHKQLIQKTKQQYSFFLKHKIQEGKQDEIETFLNNINKEYKKNEQLNFQNFLSSLSFQTNTPLEETKQALEREIDNYRIDILDTFTKENMLSKIQKQQVDQATLIAMFESHPLIQNLKAEKQKRIDYLKQLETLQIDLNEIYQIQNQFQREANQWITRDDIIFEKLNSFVQKYNIDKVVTKEEKNVTLSPKANKRVPILCYHGILDEPWGVTSMFVTVQNFDAQMKYLKDQGYTTIFVSEIAEAAQYEKPIIITFDDGYSDVYTNAFPILQKYNMKANVYMISDWINGEVYMTSEMTKTMANSPLIEIGSHTVTHQALATLSAEQIDYQLRESKRSLEELIGKKIDVIAYPAGSYNQLVMDTANKYYRYGLSSVEGTEDLNCLNTYDLRRIYVYRKYTLPDFQQLLS